MEHVHLAWGLGGGERVMRYGDADDAGGSAETVEEDRGWFFEEVGRADAAIVRMPSPETPGVGHRETLRVTLVEMIDALHAGQALRFAALGRMIR